MKTITAFLVCLLWLGICRALPLQSGGQNVFSSHSNSSDVYQAWVRDYASGSIPSLDYATALTVDTEGNVYFTGYTTNPPFGLNFLTAKYDNHGNSIWSANYDGADHSDDFASAMAVDAGGNVYVTGKSWAPGGGTDYTTVKYNRRGEQQWAVCYDGPASLSDEASSVAIDAAGNVYVTGNSRDVDGYYDYATIKYGGNGAEQWVVRYEKLEAPFDRFVSVAVDAAGDILVAGESQGDFLILKYDQAGVELWTALYDHPNHFYDFVTAMTTDSSGNVYVTGVSGPELATVKYSAGGKKRWAVSYGGPGGRSDVPAALAIDGFGNVYVTGRSVGSGRGYDYVTIKYDSAGTEQWQNRYDGPGMNEDRATAIGIDGSGNVYVTGFSQDSSGAYEFATIKYNSKDEVIWIARYEGAVYSSDRTVALAVDSMGHIYVAGQTFSRDTWWDAAVLQYDSTGAEQWSAPYNGPNRSLDWATAITADDAGNVYVTGRSASPTTLDDYAAVKYDSDGEQQWIVRYDGPAQSDDQPNAIAVDGVGNVYVCGKSRGIGSGFDWATIKYDAAGAQQWVARHNEFENSTDEAFAIAVDRDGNVYVSGSSYFAHTTIKYDAAGTEQWIGRLQLSGINVSSATALALDVAGNVYVTGEAGSDRDADYVTVKYDPAGVVQWLKRYDSAQANGADFASAVAVDDYGNVCVTGRSNGDYATIKYDTAGATLWVASYNGPGNTNDSPVALAIDKVGNVYVTGSSSYSLDYVFYSDFATVKYNSAGVEQWVNGFGAPEKGIYFPSAMVLDEAGDVYVAGRNSGSAGANQSTIIKYNPAGQQQWRTGHRGVGGATYVISGLAIDAAYNVYMTGVSHNSGLEGDYGSYFTTIKYSQTLVAVEENDASEPGRYHLSQNFPNPFNPATTIRFSLSKSGHVTLKVFNLTGQEVTMLINEDKPVGEFELQWRPKDLPSGVYVYRLQVGGFLESKKLLLLR